MRDKINKLKEMMTENNPEAMDYLEQIVDECTDEQELKELGFLASELLQECKQELADLENEVAESSIREEMGDLADVINFAYIARVYFNKSKYWLYQRLNGYKVNGKRAEFTPEERETFNFALNDVKNKLANFSLA
ncbi:DUF5053 domain-containing protein [Ornithobacterium rhinotracheale]|uniref:DUF5053 domain-containing protein n=1 Tax=Ornithobacterium rhinotracheale TaxID=28251 RepID=UPI001FF23472|nr:DUF5053 domain-containing protein [Ornithobacterium rhinotracheale]MCK0203551.1 DUF5053 domain-containing protein [Ornithobacterium rhinotracheale]